MIIPRFFRIVGLVFDVIIAAKYSIPISGCESIKSRLGYYQNQKPIQAIAKGKMMARTTNNHEEHEDLDSSWKTDYEELTLDSPLRELAERPIYTKTSDQNGHGENIQAYMPPSFGRIIDNEILPVGRAAGKYKARSDVIRDAMYRGVMIQRLMLGMKGWHIDAVITDQEERVKQHADINRRADEFVINLKLLWDHGEKDQAINDMLGYVQAIKSSPERERYHRALENALMKAELLELLKRTIDA